MNTTITHDDPRLAESKSAITARVRVWDLPVRIFHWALLLRSARHTFWPKPSACVRCT